ncbi:hypothetical protein ACEPAG_4952 [Sanghuangporus baumii]
MAATGINGQPRPSMRRKSSAQTLLSSFKSNPGNQPTTAPPTQLTMQIPSALNSGLSGFSGGTSTPNSTSQREWDAQSIKSDSINSASLPLNQGANGSPAIPQGTSLESLRDLTMKRMITLTYLRNVHEGRAHWFNTVMMTRADLDREFNNATMKKRTLSFAILGMSLSSVFDNTSSTELLKSLLNILAEHEQSKDENYKPKMRGLFRMGKMPRRGTNAMNDLAMTVPEAGETTFLVTPHIPFPLDYHQTLLSLLDILSEVYHRLSKILGPSPFPQTGQHMMGPLGVLAPAPGLSYLFQGTEANQSHDGESSSLWGIANASGNLPGMPAGGALMSPPASWSPVLGDMILKIDGKLKKIIGLLLKELDQLARSSIKDELASLDPLLRNQTIPESSREQYDYDGGGY